MSFNLDEKISKKKDGFIEVILRGMSTVDEHSTTRRRVSASRKAKSEPKQSENTPNINASDVKQAYQVPPGITTIKKTYLLSLCKENLIPRPYGQFFENMKTSGSGDRVHEVTDEESF